MTIVYHIDVKVLNNSDTFYKDDKIIQKCYICSFYFYKT